MTKDELNQWYTLYRQVWNGWHMEPSDKKELIRLNYLVLEAAQNIHNDHMIDKSW